MVCHPDPKQRQWAGPPRGCHARRSKKEAKIIYLKYELDASQLAVELCSSDPAVRANATSALQAIEHARWSITDFLDFDWKQNANHLFPLVVEPGIDSFTNQTDQAVDWIYARQQFEPQTKFAARRRYLQQQNTTSPVEHSSHALKRKLTPEAEQCLVHFYRQDYEILNQIRQLACKTDACRQGIASILARRAPLLEQTSTAVVQR